MNNFHIYEEVGRGKYSVVYKGRKKKTIDYVAVKSVEKNRRKKVLNEVRIFHNLKNRHILKFFNWYETRNHLWIIFEYCAGGDLFQLIEQDKKLPEETIKKFGRDLTQGLYYLHANGVVYCDLKPSNILLNEYSTLKLCDFGLARKLVDLQTAATNKATAEAGTTEENGKAKSGTPYYMAPELFQDDGVHSFQSDTWALGCVLYEMATGRPPFAASGLKDLINQIQEAEVPKVEGFSVMFSDLLNRLLEKDPCKRIPWEHLRKHPFWTKEINVRKLPRQPTFDSYLKQRGINADEFQEQQTRDGYFIPNMLHFKQPCKVDPMRVSQNVKKNMLKEATEYANTKAKPSDNVQDVQLISRDQELIFSGKADDEDELEDDSKTKPSDTAKTAPSAIAKDTTAVQESMKAQSTSGIEQVAATTTQNGALFKEGSGAAVGAGRKRTEDDPDSASVGDNTNNYGNEESKTATKVNAVTPAKDTETQGKPAVGATGADGASNQQQIMGLDSNAQSTTQQTKVPLKTIDQLLIHNSDTAVKPIIGNKDIEKHGELVFNAQLLPFEAWNAEQVAAKIDSMQLETHLHEVYNAMGASSTVNDKLNVLIYFESIILNSNVANRLINSAFMSILMKLLKNVKSPHLKMRLCSILGQLVRHSTVIGNDVAESGLAQLLVEVVKDKNEKVRRKAVASLGELLFYAATQLDDEQADPIWEIPEVAVNMLVTCLAAGEDEVVRFYACKTVENITAQSISAGCSFATLKVAALLMNIYHTVTNEPLKISAAVTISHICKLNTTLFPTIFESLTIKNFSIALLEGIPRIQQAFLTMLNIALTQPYAKLDETLQADDSFQIALSKLLENQSIVLRGKTLLTYLLLFKMNSVWFVIATELDFYKNIDKLLRDNFKYVQCCLLCLIESVSEMCPQLILQTTEAFKLTIANQGTLPQETNDLNSKGVRNVLTRSKSEFSNLRGSLLLMLAFQEMVSSSSFKQKLVQQNFIEMLTQLIESCEVVKSQQVDDFRRATFYVIETLAKHTKLLNLHHQVFLDKFLPALAAKIESQTADVRFIALKVFTDYITQFMCEDKIYQPQENTQTTQLLNELLLKKFLANYGMIVTDKEPMPLYGLKLLSVIVERNQAFVMILRKLQLVSVLFEYFAVGHQKFNAFTVKIVRAIVASREIELEELLKMDIVKKINGVMADVVSNNQEWCSDHLLIIMNEILHLAAELKKRLPGSEIPQQVFDELLVNFASFSKLLTASDISIVEGASYNMLAFIHFSMIQGIQKNDLLTISDEQMGSILPAFKLEKQTIAKNLLKSLYWALTLGKNPLVLNNENAKQLAKVGESYIQVDDKSLGNTAREVVKICRNQL